MKIRPANLFWLIFLALVVGGFICALIPPRPDTSGQKLLAGTRQLLRQQGFKADLSDFDFSTPPEMRARENILKATASNQSGPPVPEQQNLLEIIGTNSALVVWKQASLKRMYGSPLEGGNEMTWNDFRNSLAENRVQVDAACDAVLSNPIAFNLATRHGSDMLLPHLAVLKNLTQTLGSRLMLALHDGDKEAAFTNLLAATRLVTAWKIEPVEISHLIRFADTKIVFGATWQALQTNNWADDQLARLQKEWESVNFFTNLQEIVAFQRASRIAAYDYDRQEIMHPSIPFGEFLRETWPNPLNAWQEFQSLWRQRAYLQGGKYDEEKEVMLFYRDREIERRDAVQAATWMQMRQLPGVTNEVLFQSKYNSRIQMMENLRRRTMTLQRQGFSFLGRAADAEAERRILLAALALERFHARHGVYPQTLAGLAPEFLNTVPADFMDGQPLRYQLADDGHFLLYSVGLDCVDDGGKVLEREDRMSELREFRATGVAPREDIVWPLPAGVAAMQQHQQIQTAAQKRQAKAEEARQKHYLAEISDREWQQSLTRQSRVSKILAMKRPVGYPEPTFKGQSAGSLIRNAEVLGTNQLSLDALLTPRQIITGKEPEDITFELPIRYDSFVTNNIVFPIVDADPEEELPFDCGGKVYGRKRATNGDCLLVWHAIYDPPGRHAVQIYLALEDKRGGTLYGIGPPIPVTTSNLCQFSLDCANYDPEVGARFHARLPEKNGKFSIECLTTNGLHLATLAGSTSNGEFNIVWNLVADDGHRLTGETFNSVVQITLPDSVLSQTLRGP